MMTKPLRIKRQIAYMEDALLRVRDGKTVDFLKELTDVHNHLIVARDLVDDLVKEDLAKKRA